MCVGLFVPVCGGGYLIKFNSIMISREPPLFCFIVQMDKLLSACALHSELILHLFKRLPSLLLSSSCEWNLCHEIARASLLCMRVCLSVLNFIYATFYPLIFYAKFLLACSTCLLCTTLFLTSCFSIIVYDLLFVLTKPNWTFLLYFFLFSSG